MPKILVTASTGSQGSGVVKALASLSLAESLHVNALVRDPDAPRAKALLEVSRAHTQNTVNLCRGTFDSSDSLSEAISGCSMVFINLAPNFADTEAEFGHMKNILSAFLTSSSPSNEQKWVIYSAGIGSHYPESSLADLDEGPMKSIYQVKIRCHQYVIEQCTQAGVAYTILQPGHFFSNWLPPMCDWAWPGLKRPSGVAEYRHLLRCAYKPDTELACLDQTTLVGNAVARIVKDGARLHDKSILPLASQNLTIGQIAETMNRILQRHNSAATVHAACLDQEAAQEEARTNPRIGSQLRQSQGPWKISVDVNEVVKLVGHVKSFETFLEENFDRLESALGL